MRGRKPKPVKHQISAGDPSHVGKAKLDKHLANLPIAARRLGDPPRHLSGLAAQQWAIWRDDLARLGMDYRADRVMLEGACVAYARAIEADEILKDGCQVEEPYVDKMTGELGHILKKHPAVSVSNVSWRRVRSFCAELGLSLISRTRLSIEAPTLGRESLMELLLKPRPAKPVQ
jgi:P27 family predicted phage terminase small subunit